MMPLRAALPALVLAIFGCLPLHAAGTSDEAAAQDQAERQQALQSVQQAAPAVLGCLLSYVLGGCTAEVNGGVSADLAINCPWVSGHIRTNLSGAIKGDPSLEKTAINWLKANGPVGMAAGLAAGHVTPELLEQLATQAPEKLDQFLLFVGQQAPEALGQAALKTMQVAGNGVPDLLLVAARKYPKLAARGIGFAARHCPALLPKLARLLVCKGPATATQAP